MAWIWREGIGKFPPNPEAKKKRISIFLAEIPEMEKLQNSYFHIFCSTSKTT